MAIDKPIPNTRLDERLVPYRETTDDPRRKAVLQVCCPCLLLAVRSLELGVLAIEHWFGRTSPPLTVSYHLRLISSVQFDWANSCALRSMNPVGIASKVEEALLWLPVWEP